MTFPRDQIQHKVIDFSYVNIGQGPGGESMLRPLPNRIRELRDELFTGSTFLDTLAKEEDIQTILTEEGARVSVMNASSQADLGDRAVAYLRSQGVNVVEQGNVSPSAFSTITFMAPNLTRLSFDPTDEYYQPPRWSPMPITVATRLISSSFSAMTSPIITLCHSALLSK